MECVSYIYFCLFIYFVFIFKCKILLFLCLRNEIVRIRCTNVRILDLDMVYDLCILNISSYYFNNIVLSHQPFLSRFQNALQAIYQLLYVLQ